MPVESAPLFPLKKLSDSFQNEAIFSSKSEIENLCSNPSLNLELENITSSLKGEGQDQYLASGGSHNFTT